MKKKNLVIFFAFILVFDACRQDNFQKFIGRIYILESQDAFFKIIANNIAHYYSINEHGEQKISRHEATLEIMNDSTIIVKIKYSPNSDNPTIILHYHADKDYWLDDDSISVYRRIKKIKFNDFELSE